MEFKRGHSINANFADKLKELSSKKYQFDLDLETKNHCDFLLCSYNNYNKFGNYRAKGSKVN